MRPESGFEETDQTKIAKLEAVDEQRSLGIAVLGQLVLVRRRRYIHCT